jgi:hypothetical protein
MDLGHVDTSVRAGAISAPSRDGGVGKTSH